MRELGLPKGTVKMWAFQFVSMGIGRFIHRYNSQFSQWLPNEEDVLAHLWMLTSSRFSQPHDDGK